MAGEPRSTPENDEPPRKEGLADTIPASEPANEQMGDLLGTPVAAPAVERYRLGAELGRGGMGRVVEAFDLQLGRTVALKEVLPRAGSGSARRFAREVQLTARLEHPSIVPLYDAGVTVDGRPYYVMRRVSGRPFDELVQRARGLGERLTLLPALLSAIDAVAHAHRRGVIHRDVKPQNILVGELGETVVIDWGLAKVIGEDDEELHASRDSLKPSDSLQTQVGAVFGTPGFMAPEQARGEELDPRGDVYALGATLYQLLAGTPPHAGASATDVIDKTLRHQMVPLAEVAPGAPAELVTIVTKALAHDPAHRYPHAGALGEDVRRFLAGQLVAAHRYTPRQKVMRFARRHRAALAVAALAAVAVAVLAWIGVARIVTERDAADVARGAAVDGQRAAEDANARLAERHDALLVTQARALLDSNPTEALAALKQLPATSTRLAEARAVAQAAVARGVAWALESTHAHTIIAELSPDGRSLVQIARDGVVSVFDLEVRKLVLSRPFAEGTRAIWVANRKILVTHNKGPTLLLDPFTNLVDPIPFHNVAYAIADAAGEHVVFLSNEPGVHTYNLVTREHATFDAGKFYRSVEIAPEGTWFAYANEDELVVVDRGKEVVRAGGGVRIEVSAHRTLAVLADGKLSELVLDPKPAWKELPITASRPHMIADLAYRGRELLVYATSGALTAWNGERAFLKATIDRVNYHVGLAASGVAVLPASDSKLHLIGDQARVSVALPSVITNARLVTRPSSSRIAMVGKGLIIVYELDAIFPKSRRIEIGTDAMFVDDTTLLTWRQAALAWKFLDLDTGRETTFPFPDPELIQLWDTDATGRILIARGFAERSSIVMIRKGSSEVRTITKGERCWARLIPGDGLIYGLGDGRVFGQVGDGPPRELVKLDGVADSGAPIGHLRFAAHSSVGELVRGDLVTGEIERARVPAGTNGIIMSDLAGNLLISEDHRLLLWAATVTELATFDQPIVRIDTVVGGAAVTLRDLAVHFIELRVGAKPARLLPPGKGLPSVSADGKLLASIGNLGQVNVVELPTRSRWSLPTVPAADRITLSPTARKLMQNTGHYLLTWQLPEAGPDFAAWLDEQTNATVDGDAVFTWPWQLVTSP